MQFIAEMLALMADPSWIKKAAILSATLAGPAAILLVQAWRHGNRDAGSTLRKSLPSWVGSVFLGTYAAWFANVTFQISVGFMVAWPLFGIVLAAFGCVVSLFAGRGKLFIANALLLALALASIIAPN